MVTLVGFENSTFDAERYRQATIDPFICPHCGKSSHSPIQHDISSLTYDEDVLEKAINNDTLDFGLMPNDVGSGKGNVVR
jgi:hypothetical protein